MCWIIVVLRSSPCINHFYEHEGRQMPLNPQKVSVFIPTVIVFIPDPPCWSKRANAIKNGKERTGNNHGREEHYLSTDSSCWIGCLTTRTFSRCVPQELVNLFKKCDAAPVQRNYRPELDTALQNGLSPTLFKLIFTMLNATRGRKEGVKTGGNMVGYTFVRSWTNQPKNWTIIPKPWQRPTNRFNTQVQWRRAWRG